MTARPPGDRIGALYRGASIVIGFLALGAAGMPLMGLLFGGAELLDRFGRLDVPGAGRAILLLLMSVGGLLGLVGWFWLTHAFWRGGTGELRKTHRLWWFFLLCGVIAVLPLVGPHWYELLLAVSTGASEGKDDLMYWWMTTVFFLPFNGLVVSSLVLFYLRQRSIAPAPLPPSAEDPLQGTR